MKSFAAAALLFLSGLFGGHHALPIFSAAQNSAAVAITDTTAPSSLAISSTAIPTNQLAASGPQQSESVFASSQRGAAAIASNAASPLAAYVTQDQLTAALNQATNSLRTLIYQTESIPGSLPATGGFTNNIALTNRIDQLTGTKLNNVTINGVSGLTASDIPALSSLSGVLSTSRGGIGTSTTPGPNQLLLSDANGSWEYVATSSLGIIGGGLSLAGTPGQVGYFSGANTAVGTSSLFINDNGNIGIGTTSPGTALSVSGGLSLTDNGVTSTAQLGSELTSDGSFLSDPTAIWDLGPGWSWDSTNHRAQYTGTGGPIVKNLAQSSMEIANGGTGYSNGDTITIACGSNDATYTAAVGTGGKVGTLTQVSAGTSYTSGTTCATTGGTGTGLTVVIIRIADGAAVSQTISLPSSSMELVTFTIVGYSAGAIKSTAYYTAFYSNNTGGFEFYKANGTYQFVLAASTTLSFTPTQDFAGEITNISVESIAAPAAVESVNNTDNSVGLELRPGGIGLQNSFVGFDAGESNTTGGEQTAFGYEALSANTTGFWNTAVGTQALADNTTGNQNSAFGYGALSVNTTGSRNTAVGIFALLYNNTGSENTAFGYNSDGNAISGNFDTAYGYGSLNGNVSGNNNTALGAQTLFSAYNGSGNLALGFSALLGLTTGSNNIGIGNTVGKATLTTGSYNILIGNLIDTASSTINQELDIGNVLYGSGMYNGAGASSVPVVAGKIAVGTSTPYSRLTVWGSDTFAGTQAFSVVNNASTTIFTVNDSGNVGIGNSSPTAPLDVSGNILLDGSNNYINFGLGTGNAGYGFQDSSGTLEFKNSSGAWTPLGAGGAPLGMAVSYVKSLDVNAGEVVDSNSASATTVYTYPVQANALGTNKVLRVVISGNYLNNSGASKTLALTMQYGGTTLVSKASGSVTTSGASGGWQATFYLAATSSTAQVGSFQASVSNGASSVSWGGGGVSSVDSTQAQNLVVQVTNSTAAATIVTTKESAETELLNATDTFGSQWTTNGASISYATTSATVAIGTTTPYARLSVWGPDAASSTLAFNVVNSASTTVFAVYDGGNAQLSGTLTQSSDQRLKTNIQSLDASSSLSLVNELNPVTFNWIDQSRDSTTQVGFIAQDVQKIFPELIATTSATALTPDGTLGLNYIGLIAPLVKAVQALSTEVQSLVATVQGFSEKFVSHEVDTDQLCVTDANGKTCVTRSQLDAVLSEIGSQSTPLPQTPSPSIVPAQTAASSDEQASSTDAISPPSDTASTTASVFPVATSSDATTTEASFPAQ
jgi:hypothetical protein